MRAGALLAGLSGASACSVLAGIEDWTSAGGSADAAGGTGTHSGGAAGTQPTVTEPGGAGGAGAAGAAGSGGTAGSGGAGACTVLYVSASAGSDGHDGCEPDSPKETLVAALAAAASRRPSIQEVRVCEGSYDGPFVLQIPVSLLGGYDCATWKRTPKYGYPDFDGADLTLLTSDSGPAGEPTLRIAGISVGEGVVIDGFSVLAPAPNEDGPTPPAVSVLQDAKPHLSNNIIQGGTGDGVEGPGSVGLFVDEGAAPEVAGNLIDGGSGSTSGGGLVAASVGVLVGGAGAPTIVGSSIGGGSGAGMAAGSIGSVGVLWVGSPGATGDNALFGNWIDGGQGSGVAVTWHSIAVYVVTGSVDLVRNSIFGGEGSRSVAIYSITNGALVLRGNRIHGGEPAATRLPSGRHAAGAYVFNSPWLLAENNLISGGDAGGDPTPMSSYGLLVAELNGAVLRHNTIFGGRAAGEAKGVYLGGNALDAVMQNNVVFGNSGSQEMGIHVHVCGSPPGLATFENNVLFGHGAGHASHCDGPLLTIGALQNALAGDGTSAENNHAIHATCIAEPAGSCSTRPACAIGGAACLQGFFESWDLASAGKAELFDAVGWRLQQGAPCAVQKSSLFLPDVPFDSFDDERTDPSSMGADERDGECTE